jgi:hypothetical protein
VTTSTNLADRKLVEHALVDSSKHVVGLNGDVFPYHLAETPRTEMRDGALIVHLPVLVRDTLHVVGEDGTTAVFTAEQL